MPLLLACASPGPKGSGDESDVGDSADSGALHTLVVEGGYGGGSFAAGATVHVWSAVDPQAAIVTGWTGGVGLGAPAEWNSAFVMPEADVTLIAATETVALPILEETLTLPSGARDLLTVLPANPTALVLFFHGAAYSRAELRDHAAASLARRLVRAGYGVVAVESGWG